MDANNVGIFKQAKNRTVDREDRFLRRSRKAARICAVFGERGRPGRPRADSVPGRKMELSPRQLDILQMCASGMSRKQVASRLGISIETVKTLMHTAYIRLGASNLMEAIVRAKLLHPGFDEQAEAAPAQPAEPLALAPLVTQLPNGMTVQIVVNLRLPPGAQAQGKDANAGNGEDAGP